MRKRNFFAGPGTLPFDVLEQIRDNFVEYRGNGLSLVEVSHRSAIYGDVHNHAINLLRELLEIPEEFQILFLGGGATLQFTMVPMNLLIEDRSCDFVVSGSWAKKAFDDARKVGSVNVLFDGNTNGYTSLPETFTPSDGSAYIHITSNETIGGVQWSFWPDSGEVPLVVDISSDVMSREIDFRRVALAYGSVQKNLGPAGLAIVIIRDDLLDRSPDNLTAYLSYKTHAEKQSLYNTPPVFAVYALSLVLEWVRDQGGVKEMEARSRQRSEMLYSVIDESADYFLSPISQPFRSKMNVVFRLQSEDLEKIFLEESEREGMIGLKGHRSVGGLRASMYNAMPVEWANNLADFMRTFQNKHG